MGTSLIRFKEEGFVINYPMRTLEFPKDWGPESLGRVNGGSQAVGHRLSCMFPRNRIKRSNRVAGIHVQHRPMRPLDGRRATGYNSGCHPGRGPVAQAVRARS